MRKVFIDCGAHCGESIIRARNQFGDDTIIISFEAVPMLASQLQDIYKDDNLVEVMNAAVYIKDDILDFNICPAFTDGSSILSTLNNNHLAKSIKVPCFDLSTWIRDSFNDNDYIILKLDIEGAEYDVLDKLINDGTINKIKELHGEWHYGHIINNLNEDEKRKFITKVNSVQNKLKDLNKEMKIWEAYYDSNNANLAKRPISLYN